MNRKVLAVVTSFWALQACQLAIAGEAAAADSYARIETRDGVLQGSVNSTTRSYLGIPFAKPPVGVLRWQPPQPPDAWQGVRDATHFRNHCLNGGGGSQWREANANEDCLYLNVYVPLKPATAAKLPVMVWFYGGSHAGGAGEFYDPTPLLDVAQDVIVVTLNYRLGTLGFLAHPALDAEDHPSVNYGVMDEMAALKWVRANIDRFGGDARNVTIFGESAGGLDVTTLLVSPLAAGLFERAIIQSGSYQLDTPSLEDSESRGLAFARRAGCEDQTAACLRALSADTILQHTGIVGTPGSAVNHSTIDGKILVESQHHALAAGRFNRVPVLVGNNSDEGHTGVDRSITLEEHRALLESTLPALGKDPARAYALYSLQRYGNPYEAASAAAGDRLFASGAQFCAQMLGKWTSVYSYELADANASAYGAAHGSELKYLFNVAYDPEMVRASGKWADVWKSMEGRPNILPSASQKLSLAMRTSWIAFAKSANPSSALIPNWPLASRGVMILKPKQSTVQSSTAFCTHHQCAFWNER